MKKECRVIPYQVKEVVDLSTEIPKGIELIQAPDLWNKTKGKGITIAILDTGCDINHPDLQERIIGGKNFTDDDNGNSEIYMDYNGHGTHVAGTIGASGSDSGLTGVAPEVSLLIVKVLNGQGSGL